MRERALDSTRHVDTTLVECLMLAVSDVDRIDVVLQALVDLAQRDVVRILDVVCLTREADDAGVSVHEVGGEVSSALPTDAKTEVRWMLTDRDLHRAALLLEPGDTAVLALVEDRWATRLSLACRNGGGGVVGGERIAPARVELMMSPADPGPGETTDMAEDGPRREGRSAPSRPSGPDLLRVFPHTDPEQSDRWIDLIVDPADRLAQMTELFERGMISLEQYESQKNRIFGRAGRPRQ